MANSAIRNTFTQYPNEIENNFGWVGQALTAVAGEDLSFGDFVRYNLTTGKWYKAKADVYETARCDGVWVDTTTLTDASGTIMTEGVIRNDNWSFGEVAQWLSPSVAGEITDTQPYTFGDQVQYIGLAVSSNTLFFNPSNDIGEI